MQLKRAIWLVMWLGLSACNGNPPPASGPGRDRVATPDFRENRVFYITDSDKLDNKARQVLTPSWDPLPGSVRNTITNGSPVTVILDSVYFGGTGEAGETHDIAVVLDLWMAAEGQEQSLAVWYQTDVPVNTRLTFEGLTVYREAFLDDRVSPFFRIRVYDVRKERNQRNQALLDQVTRVGKTVATFVGLPIASPVLETAKAAADIIIANNRDHILLDYQVQFYSQRNYEKADTRGLAIIRNGSFATFGLPAGKASDFWAGSFQYDLNEGRIYAVSGGGAVPVPSPVVRLRVAPFDSIVPPVVARRSAYLFDTVLKTENQASVESLVQTAEAAMRSIDMFAAHESFMRYRDNASLGELMSKLADSKYKDEDVYFAIQSLRELTKGLSDPPVSREQFKTWWDTTGAKGKKPKACARIDATSFRIDMSGC